MLILCFTLLQRRQHTQLTGLGVQTRWANASRRGELVEHATANGIPKFC